MDKETKNTVRLASQKYSEHTDISFAWDYSEVTVRITTDAGDSLTATVKAGDLSNIAGLILNKRFVEARD